MTLIQYAIQQATPQWRKTLDLPFLQEMKRGTLSREKFDDYLYQDVAYLIHYVKLCGKAIYNAKNSKDIALYLSFIDISFDLEMNTRFEESINDKKSLGKEAQAYIDFIMSFADDEDNDRIFLVLLQCMLSYQYVFTEMAKEIEDLEHHPYHFFIKDYLSDTYQNHCKKWVAYAEKVYQQPDHEKTEEFIDIFLQGTRMEYHFWKGSYR